MSRFVQLHLLVSYPPSNLNRDDTGRPKTAMIGDANRLRISSQSLKRAWRTSDVFESTLQGHIGIRTKEMGEKIYDMFLKKEVSEKKAREWAKLIVGQFGKLKSDKKTENNQDLHIEQLAHFGPEEQAAIEILMDKLSVSGENPTEEDLKLLRKPRQAADIAMFGRMLASSPAFNVEAAVQVAHAITIHKVAVEDDYFSAVDDLNRGEEDVGAGHIGEAGFGAGVFYLYLCINRELLLENLGNDAALTAKTLQALVHAATKVSPTGKQNSFASRAYAAYALAEKGDQQPRSLAQAFLKPVTGGDMLERAVNELTKRYKNFDAVYGACSDSRYQFNVETGEGNLHELVKFVTE
ncbi:type I-E CRISPR-associated protein Cas7/Cse4/CasC [Nitrosomonas sp. Is35]|uniref:type I-E CRISPR-associated protein Cas7/Cse4/CasC n=1 Tax=Nitrosomonas sp. Is35 TaxID=3080534 RepID=UPI00294B1C7D|nr:type I-E CRISPR-associated protein Cas7/Cse4/CasC [Nitrosomonas sp. Is35]MDV6346094.1 type I-E CRISPR-associated protein Cas7/Cse4/CasC [Nitrosomonas sp. Is35]